MTRCLRIAIASIAVLLLFTVVGQAQIQSGNIYGKVQAKDGSVLPGVSVTLSGVGAPQTFVTDASGNFRFLNLSPGRYALKAELAGFGTSARSGITVNIGRNADVTMTLNPAAAESITVTAEAPLLDVRKAGTGTEITNVEIDKVPTGRDPWVILQQTPGVLMDRFNVGGNQSGQQSNYVSNGSSGTQSTWNVDGVNITDFAATGSSPTYYDFGSFEEMQMTTGGSDPRIMTPGVQINMVTKRGTNDIRGSARAFHTSAGYQATPKIPAEATSYLRYVNQINKVDDDGGELGGPVIKDKLWLWGAFAKQNIAILTPTLLATGARSLDKTTLKGENIKINAQPVSSNSLTLVDSYDAKIKLGRNVGVTRAPETGWNQDDLYAKGTGSLTDPTLWKLEDTQLFGPNFYLTGLYSKVQGGFQLISDNGKGCQSLACGMASDPAYVGADGSWHRSYLNEAIWRPQTQVRLDGSSFFNTGSISHELKFGYGYRKADVKTVLAWAGNQYTDFSGDTPMVEFMRQPIRNNYGKFNDLYAGDTILMGNLTFQAGLRYDQQQAANRAGEVPSNQWVPDLLPGVTYPGVTGLKWNTVSPRLGLTYSLGADKKTLLRAAYNRYVDQIGGNSVSISSTSPGAYAYLYMYFNDLNGDKIAQPNELDRDTGIIAYGGFDPAHPTVQTAYTRWASNLSAPKTDEFIFGAEHELLPDFTIGTNLIYRKLSNFTWTIGEKHQGQGDYYSSADYVTGPALTLCLTGSAGCTSSATMKPVNFLPGGQTQVQLPAYHTLAPSVAIPVFNVVANRPDYYQTYKGIELTATKRMANRWMARGNFTYADWKKHVGANGFIDPTIQRGCDVCNGTDVVVGSGTGSGSFGGVYINSKWSYSLTGAYQIPVIETSFGVNLYGRQGYALPYVYRVAAPRGEGYKYLLVGNSPTQYRNKNVQELDLRLAKDVPLPLRAALTISVDAFNVLNSQTILQRNVTRVNTASANYIQETLSPRVFRIGARLAF